MLISPPFLPSRLQTEKESDWLGRAMQQPSARAPASNALEGSYPVSAALMWHNGVHLKAPQENGIDLPVRAVADGKVIFVSQPKPHEATPSHPQNYMPDQTVAWTDNGCVIIEHTTDIGATGSTPTEITYFSLYMHLCTIESAITLNGNVYRKEALGKAGQFYGAEGQLHLEICCSKRDIERLMGRTPVWTELDLTSPVAPTGHGRTDAVFGDIFIYLPSDTPTSVSEPSTHLRAETPPVTTLRNAQWVAIRYEKGNATIRSYDLLGNQIGNVLEIAEFEYDLYLHANARHNSAMATATSSHQSISSSPSGWYELLRFGRNLGSDPLPANAAHWRIITTSNGQIWADLNWKSAATESFKFSDADFLPAMGWNVFDDDLSPTDQRCDSVNLKRWIRNPDRMDSQRMDTSSLAARLGNEVVRRKLKRAICSFPTEWNQTTVETRLRWLRAPQNSYRLDDEDNWSRFMRHCKAMTFEKLPADYLQATWRFEPGEFIEVMRRCTWISVDELAQCLPRKSIEDKNLIWSVAVARAKTHVHAINHLFRKYKGTSRQRHAHALAQIYTETGLLRTITEDGRGRNEAYGPFYGRGYFQLTWLSNYNKYGEFKSLPDHTTGEYSDNRITTTSVHFNDRGGGQLRWFPRYDPNLVNSNYMHAQDASGFYWVTKRFRGKTNINRVCDLAYDPTSVAFICWLVNGGVNGYANRQQFALFLGNILLDKAPFKGSANFEYPPLTPNRTTSKQNITPELCETFPPRVVDFILTANVYYEKQKPA